MQNNTSQHIQHIGHLLAFHRALRISYKRYKLLSAYFNHDWKAAYNATAGELIQAGIDSKSIEYFLTKKTNTNPAKEFDMLMTWGIHVLTPDNTILPEQLYNIHQPPGLLFVRGTITPQDFPAVAVVGSRKITQYGTRCTQHITNTIAAEKITIVSGLALGVDILAHKTAVTAGARTIAVLGSAINQIQPSSHRAWTEEQLQTGTLALLSEYAPDTPAVRNNFVIRNRIVAGITKGIVVIQAAHKSGSIATAKYALEQGREVFGVPGDIFVPQYEGTNQLIRDGAVPIASGLDVLEHLRLEHHQKHQKVKAVLPPEDDTEAAILRLFDDEPVWQRHKIIEVIALPHHTTAATITMMELKGMIVPDSAGAYRLG